MFYKNLYTILNGEKEYQLHNKVYGIVDQIDDQTLSKVFVDIVSQMWDDANLAYTILNGKINYMNPSIKLILAKSADSKNVLGWNNANTIYIDLENILDRLIKIDANPLETRGYILMTIAHELAHLDQDIDYVKMKNNESYRECMEVTNHSYCLKYIQCNYKELQNQYGDFTMKYDDLAKSVDFEKLSKYYIRIPSIKNKIYNILNSIIEGIDVKFNEEYDKKINSIICINENNNIHTLIKQNGNYLNPSSVLDDLKYITDMEQVSSNLKIYKLKNTDLIDIELTILKNNINNKIDVMSFK